MHNMDSLAAVRFVSAIKENFGIEITPKLIYEFPDIHSLVKQIQFLISLNNQGCDVSNLNTRVKSYNWFKLAKIDEEFKNKISKNISIDKKIPRIIIHENKSSSSPCFLFTGVTGFIGKFLLDSLISNFCSSFDEFKIFCIVRAENDEMAKNRLISELKNSLLWKRLEKYFIKNIFVLSGDISLDFFGLSESNYQMLVDNVDEIYHCAAEVNSVKSYASLAPANVKGTQNILTFCYEIDTEIKMLHYISTMGVYNGNISENRQLPSPHEINLDSSSGYNQSKWVAEKLLINAAQTLALPLTVHRPGLVSGHRET